MQTYVIIKQEQDGETRSWLEAIMWVLYRRPRGGHMAYTYQGEFHL